MWLESLLEVLCSLYVNPIFLRLLHLYDDICAIIHRHMQDLLILVMVKELTVLVDYCFK